MHDLLETNPRLMLFLAELPWCCFCAEIKVLGMERNFARIFYINNKNFWSKTHQRGAPGWARPPLLACPGGLYQPGGPADDPPDTIKSHISRKNQGERIIAIHETEPPPSPVLPREGRSGVRLGLQRGESVAIVIINLPPSPIS